MKGQARIRALSSAFFLVERLLEKKSVRTLSLLDAVLNNRFKKMIIRLFLINIFVSKNKAHFQKLLSRKTDSNLFLKKRLHGIPILLANKSPKYIMPFFLIKKISFTFLHFVIIRIHSNRTFFQRICQLAPKLLISQTQIDSDHNWSKIWRRAKPQHFDSC
jgi:hypothetical protein